jgi:hypothetical protein
VTWGCKPPRPSLGGAARLQFVDPRCYGARRERDRDGEEWLHRAGRCSQGWTRSASTRCYGSVTRSPSDRATSSSKPAIGPMGMFVVLEGEAQVEIGGRFHRLRPGDFFGEMALLVPDKRLATVRAVEPVKSAADLLRSVPGLPARASARCHRDAASADGAAPRGRATDRRLDGIVGDGTVREMRHLDGSSQESEVGVELDDPGRIVVDGKFRTTATGVYAAGDVIGPPPSRRSPPSRGGSRRRERSTSSST